MSPFSEALREYLAAPGPHRLEVGSAENAVPGWFSTDLRAHESNTAPVHAMDATQPFPICESSFDYIYCEHMIEHVPFTAAANMLQEFYRVLKPGGVARIITPSLGMILRIMTTDRNVLEEQYMQWSIQTFVPEAPIPLPSFFFNNFVRNWGHTFVYDRQTLKLSLERAGFREPIECALGKSIHSSLAGRERQDRLPPGYLEFESMIFEATKQ